jgi:hypothetical protein
VLVVRRLVREERTYVSNLQKRSKDIDYDIILQGKLTLLLDEGEVEPKRFDVVIQRATNHGWINKGPETVLMATIVVDCETPPEWGKAIRTV